MVEGTNLFTDNRGGRWKSALPHMARMISLLGPPPQDLLDITPVTKAYFDRNGMRLIRTPVHLVANHHHVGRLKKGHEIAQTSLEEEATALEGVEKAEFLRFLRRLLQWEPSKRPSARELLKDSWLTPPTNLEDS